MAQMLSTNKIIQVLGGKSVLKRNISSETQLREAVREGLPYESLAIVVEKLGIKGDKVAEVIQLPLRTIARRKKEKRLEPDESDRVVRLARIGAMAAYVLGNEQKASVWLHERNRALGGIAPLDILDTDIGTRQVEEVLGRIEHGVYS
jgi:putative toxin-antitoxin system antitoxin component (TIGR02293 family)